MVVTVKYSHTTLVNLSLDINMNLNYYHFFEVLSLACSLAFYKGLKQKGIAAYLPFLFITVVVEITASNWFYWTGNVRNDIVYNIYFLFITPIQLYLFYSMLRIGGASKLIFLVFSTLTYLFVLINFFFLQKMNLFNNYSFILYEITNIFFCSIILFKLCFKDEAEVNFLKEPFFWICGGNLLFSLGSLVIILLREFILLYDLKLNGKHIYQVLIPYLIVILYSAYSYGFYLCKQQMMK